jgi:DNA end-binding protein Ku
MDLAHTLIDSMSDTFDPNRYKDDYYEKVMDVIRMKVAGVATEAPAPAGPRPAKVVDLMEVLKQSLNETRKAKAARTPAAEETVAGDGRSSKAGRTRKAR